MYSVSLEENSVPVPVPVPRAREDPYLPGS